MKIAIFHNFLDNIGGAEMVTLTLARELDADIYTTNVDKAMIEKMGFGTENIFSIGSVPVNAPFRQQLTLLRFRFLRLEGCYDAHIIAGDWAVSGAVHNKPVLWYVHSPIREIWDLYSYVRGTLVSPLKRPLFDVWVWCNRAFNRRHVTHVGACVCNSENTRSRIKNYLNRDATVIFPPVDTRTFASSESKGYWLSVNRFNKQKRTAVQFEAFAQLPDEKLICVGSYEQSDHFLEEAERLRNLKPDNVEIKSWVPADELRKLYAHAKGFITTARDEDFGMTAVEAMAAGKPVIAPYEGGYKETVTEGVTGTFLDDVSPAALIASVQKLSPHAEEYREACIAHAQTFDTELFIQKIQALLQETVVQNHE